MNSPSRRALAAPVFLLGLLGLSACADGAPSDAPSSSSAPVSFMDVTAPTLTAQENEKTATRIKDTIEDRSELLCSAIKPGGYNWDGEEFYCRTEATQSINRAMHVFVHPDVNRVVEEISTTGQVVQQGGFAKENALAGSNWMIEGLHDGGDGELFSQLHQDLGGLLIDISTQ